MTINTDRNQLKTMLRQDEEKIWELYAMDIIRERWLRFLRPAQRTDYIGWLKGYIAHGGKPTRVYDYPLHEREIRNFYVATKDLTVIAIPHESGRNIIIPQGINVNIKDSGNYNLYYLDEFVHIGEDVPIYQDMEEEVGFMG